MHKAYDIAQNNVDVISCFLGSGLTGFLMNLVRAKFTSCSMHGTDVKGLFKCWIHVPVQKQQHKNTVYPSSWDWKGSACKIMRWALHEEIIVRINIFLSQSTKRQNFHIRNAICNHTVYYAQIWRENQRKRLVWQKTNKQKRTKTESKV